MNRQELSRHRPRTVTLGLDLGGTKLLGLATDASGAVLARAKRDTGRATTPRRALELALSVVDELTRGDGFEAVGVGFPGLVDAPQGVCRSSVMLDGWSEVPFARDLGARLGVPCAVDNDVNAAAVAELSLRRAKGAPARSDDALLFVAVGTGIGGALAFGGALWRGRSGTAGELGNVVVDPSGPVCWCGRRGCANMFASGTALDRAWGSARPLEEALAAGDGRAKTVVREAAEALGRALADAVQLVNPTAIVLGGGVARLGEPWRAEVERTLRAEAFREAMEVCSVELALGGYEAGALGAALLAREAVS